MVRQWLRSILWLFVVALGTLAQPLHAQSPAGAVPVQTYTGFFNGSAVYFTAFETNSSNFAAVNHLVFAPRLSNSNLAGVANMIFFQNGSAGQATVLQTEPGFSDYSPIWHVIAAAWRGPGAMPLITSYAAALQWWRRGNLILQVTGIVFNGPVIVINRPLGMVGGGQLAPTISPNEFMGINPAARTAFFAGHQGYFGGQLVTFLALEHAPGVIAQAPGAIPVPLIDLAHLGHAAIDNFFVVPGQLPVLDAFPGQQVVTNPGTTSPPAMVYGAGAGIAGKTGQTPPPPQGTGQTPQTPQQPVAGVSGTQAISDMGPLTGSDLNTLPFFSMGPYAGQYSPIWHVHQVMFRPGVSARLIGSVQDLAAALSSGLAVQIDGGVQDTFNCPIVSAGQAFVPPTTTPGGTGGTPGYVPPTTTPTGGTGGMPPFTPPMTGTGGTPGSTPPPGY